MNTESIDGVVGRRVLIPAWAECGKVVSFDADELCYTVELDCGDEAYVPMYMVEVIH